MPARRTIKVSKKTLAQFKDARGINDPRRASKIRTYAVQYEYFCNTFLPEWRHCESAKDIMWVYDQEVCDMFGGYVEEDFEIEMYYVEYDSSCMACLCWRAPRYSSEWREVRYNTSSVFAANLCELDCDLYAEESEASSEEEWPSEEK